MIKGRLLASGFWLLASGGWLLVIFLPIGYKQALRNEGSLT
jgi:hypothetical protein